MTVSETQARKHRPAPATGADTVAALPDHVTADRTATTDLDSLLPPGWGDLITDTVRRNRNQLLPHYLTAGLMMLAQAIHEMSAQADTFAAAALLAGTACATGGLTGYLWLRRRHDWLRSWAWWAGLVTTATATWMVLAVVSGLTWGTLTAALAIDAAAGARWWRLHRHQIVEHATGQQEEPSLPALDDDGMSTLFAQRWAEHIGAAGKLLPGSILVPCGEFAHGVEYTLKLARGTQDLDQVLALMGKIATGLGRPQQYLIAERYPAGSVPAQDDHEHIGVLEDPALVRFRVVLRSPIKNDVYFRGPRFANGNITLGPYADGVGEALWRLYSHNSMWGGMVIGGTGSGKSRLLEIIALVALWTGMTYVIHVDGQDGASCPALWRYAHESYGRADVPKVLARLTAMQHSRQAQRAAERADTVSEDDPTWDGDWETATRDDIPEDTVVGAGFTPSPEFPGILVVVDEAHAVINKDNVDAWGRLAREARKMGIALIMGDQDGTLKTFLDSVLRGSLLAGNAVGLKTQERSQGQIVAGGKFNLADLPAIPGYGYTLGDEARHAPLRGEFLPGREDVKRAAASGTPIPDDVRTVGQWYRQSLRHRVSGLDHTTLTAADEAEAEADKGTKKAAGTTGPASTPAAGRFAKLKRLVLPGVRPVVPATTAPLQDTRPTSAHVVIGQTTLTETAHRVLDAVRAGQAMPGAIAEDLQLSRQQVGNLLNTLLAAELVAKTGAGKAVRYSITDRGQVA